MMKKPALLLLVFAFAILAGLCAAVTDTPAQSMVEVSQSTSGLEAIRDWRALAGLAMMLSAVLIGGAYMFGVAFDIKELKAWGAVELNQIIVTCIIILALMGVLSLLDGILMDVVNYSNLSDPVAGTTLYCKITDQKLCAIRTADAYITGLAKMMEDDSKQIVSQSVEAATYANARVSFYCQIFISPIPCLFASVSAGVPGQAQRIMDVDMYATLIEWEQNLLSSLYAQQFFVREISFKIGPLMLLLGIVTRAFFLTRRVGGLLIASAVGIMFVFPAMYAFDWLSLNVTLFGDNAFPKGSVNCPEECQVEPPLGYYTKNNSPIYDYGKLIDLFSYKDAKGTYVSGYQDAKKISDGTASSVTSKAGITVASCAYSDLNSGVTHTAKTKQGTEFTVVDNCTRSCRELPYPSALSDCQDPYTQKACFNAPWQCKITRYVGKVNASLDAICPKTCKTIPALSGDCDGGSKTSEDDQDLTWTCQDTSFNCRIALVDDIDADGKLDNLKKHTGECNSSVMCPRPSSSDASALTAYAADPTGAAVAEPNWKGMALTSCVDILPYWEPRECEAKGVCLGCPNECRITNLAKYGESYPTKAIGDTTPTMTIKPGGVSQVDYTKPASGTSGDTGDLNTGTPIDCNSNECKACPVSCKLDAVMLNDIAYSGCANAPSIRKAQTGYACSLTPLACRFTGYDYVKQGDPNAYVCQNTESIFSTEATECRKSCGISPSMPINANCKSYSSSATSPQNCQQCPLSCRIRNSDGSPNEKCSDFIPTDVQDTSDYNCSIKACPDACRVSEPAVSTACPAYSYESCDLCPLYCRVQLPGGRLPYGCPADACSFVSCSNTCKRTVPRSECQMCIESPAGYLYKPAVQKDCPTLCGGKPKGVSVSPDEYAKKTQEGMVGPQSVKTVSSVLIPGYLLPLLNILVTVMFIRSFSGILGGDIEIPGLPKVI